MILIRVLIYGINLKKVCFAKKPLFDIKLQILYNNRDNSHRDDNVAYYGVTIRWLRFLLPAPVLVWHSSIAYYEYNHTEKRRKNG